MISIHAPRTGSDNGNAIPRVDGRNFNPRSPHGERRGLSSRPRWLRYFNPRSPHGERHVAQDEVYKWFDFNPRSPHGERHICSSKRWRHSDFNPRSPHGERLMLISFSSFLLQFQSTLPARGATLYHPVKISCIMQFQSTLPARGATIRAMWKIVSGTNFNPRSPHGERRT